MRTSDNEYFCPSQVQYQVRRDPEVALDNTFKIEACVPKVCCRGLKLRAVLGFLVASSQMEGRGWQPGWGPAQTNNWAAWCQFDEL